MELRSATGLTFGVVAALAIGAIVPNLPFDVDQVHVVLIFVLVVVVAAAIGGRMAGVVTAVFATLSFDFFHTVPYRSLKVESSTDIITMLMLLVVGVVVGAVSSWAFDDSERADDEQAEIHRLHRVTELVGSGVDERALLESVSRELCSCLSVERAEFAFGSIDDSAPVLDLGGTMNRLHYRHGASGFLLDEGSVLPVHDGGTTVGGFVLEGTSDQGVPLDHRIVAAAIADLLGSALGRRHHVS